MSTLPREAKTTPYFILVKRGTNTGNILQARVCRVHIYEFLVRIKSNNQLYDGIAIDYEALNQFLGNEIYDNAFIYYDKNIDDEPYVASANNSYGNMVSSIPMPPY